MVVAAPERATTRTPDLGALAAALDTVAAFVASFEPECLSPEDAASLLSVFTRGERLCAAGVTHCAHRVARAHAHLRSGHRTPAEWLAASTGGSVGEAMALLQLGDRLADQPGVDEAFRKGELSTTRAQLVSDAARVNPGQEADLVAGAKGPDTHRQVKDRCLRAKAQGRTPEEARRHDAALQANRRCRTFTDQDGAFRLEAVLHPVQGARLLAALEARADRLFNRARRDGTRESTDAYRADALVALVTGGPDPSGPGGRPQKRTPGGQPTVPSGGKPTVHLRVDLAALRRGRMADGEICEIPGVGPVSLATAKAMMGDALLKVVITDGVDVATVCHLGRHLPEVLKTAVFERDQCCVIEGCDTRLGLETDHWLIDYADDGPLSLDNLVRLCKHHHDLKTRRGFTVEGKPGAWRLVAPETLKAPRGAKKKAKGPPTGTKRRPKRPDPPLFTAEE